MGNNTEAKASEIITSIEVDVRMGVKFGNNSYFQYQRYIQQVG